MVVFDVCFVAVLRCVAAGCWTVCSESDGVCYWMRPIYLFFVILLLHTPSYYSVLFYFLCINK